jgi:ketosteroid isomerase-like protein
MRWQYCCPMPASLELVRIALKAYGNGDCEIALALADPLIRWDERASRPDGDLVWKKREVGRAMRRYLDSWEHYRFDVEDLAEVGPGKIVGICREHGKPKDGAQIDRRFGGLWIVEDGKIASWATYLTPKEAVRAAKELLGGRIGQVKRRAAPATAPVSEPTRAEQSEPQPTVESPAAQPAQVEKASPRPRKKALTLSEEQKRAARARARLRRRASRESA